MVWPPIGGRKTSRSERVTSSGYMPPVSSKSTRRRSVSLQPNRCATPGRCQTGSIAALVTSAAPPGSRIWPSGIRRPFCTASMISGTITCALVMAMVGRMSYPAARSAANTSATMAPHGSMLTILPGSLHWGNGPMTSVGVVSVRSALCSRDNAPAATASARYTLYEPLCVPITLRWARLVGVPMSGPRSVAVGAPQRIGGASKPALCEVSRMWPEALFDLAGEGASAPASADIVVLRREAQAYPLCLLAAVLLDAALASSVSRRADRPNQSPPRNNGQGGLLGGLR